jgi:hypothetical protein
MKTRGWLLSTVIVLGLGFSDSSFGGGLDFIEGDWNNQGGDNIKIVADNLGGWEAWLGAVGQGNISNSTYKGSNIKVEAANIRCWFRATVLSGGNTMNWKLVASNGDCSYFEGYFRRQ